MANVEALLIGHFNNDPNLPAAYSQIPLDRPSSFITVERIGGGVWIVDTATLAVQTWSRESRYQASELAQQVAASLESLEDSHPDIGSVEISALYNFPDSSGDNRYQLIVRTTTI